jgi:hypothetical protein
MVAELFGESVEGEIETPGGLDESTLKLPATAMTEVPSNAQT